MKKILTRSEWDEISNLIYTGVPAEVSAGEPGHIDSHNMIAQILNYYPNMRTAIIVKETEENWAMEDAQGNPMGELPNESIGMIEGMIDELSFLVVPDKYLSSPLTLPVNSQIWMLYGPGYTWGLLGGVFPGLIETQAQVADLTARLEALENPSAPE